MKSCFLLIPMLFLAAAAASGANEIWRAESGETAEVRDHFKSPPSSRLWKWNGSGKLEIRFPRVTVPERDGAFGMWFYLEKPCSGRLHVEFFDGGKSLGKAWFNLNFRYWRPMGGPFSDIGIKPGTAISRIVLTAPPEAGSARIDELRPVYVTNAWRADHVQPWIGHKDMLKLPPGKTIFSSRDIAFNRPYLPEFLPETEISEQGKRDLKLVTERFSHPLMHSSPLSCDSVEKLEKEFSALGISGNGSGPALEFGFKNTIPLTVKGSIDFKQKLLPLFRKIQFLLPRLKGTERRRAAEIGTALCRYMLVQGYAQGNGNLGWIGNGYGWRHWPPALHALREELKRAGLLDEMAKAAGWLSGGKEMMMESPQGNCDFYFNYTSQVPLCITMMEDPAERYQRFRVLKRFYDLSLASQSPLGEDGTVHHHGGHHPAYGSYAIPALIRFQLLPLEGTQFAVAGSTREKLYRYAYALNFQLDHGKTPINLPMRAGDRLTIDGSEIALLLSKIDTPDRRMARLYLSALNGRKTGESSRFLAEGLTPLPLEGHMTFNLAALAVHRRGKVMAAAAGMLACHRGLEIYGWLENNNYGRNSRNGSLFLSIDGEDAFRTGGWNWNHIPGATSVIRTPAEIFEGYAMYGNGNNFAGGVTIPEGNGVWGMYFTGSDVSFRQGIFFFDDRITITVSDIVKANPRPGNSPGGSAVTTIFQQISSGNRISAWQDGSLLGDHLGNSYRIWKGAPQVKFQKGRQSWTYFYKRYLRNPDNNPLQDMASKSFREKKYEDNEKYYTPTRGEFALAYIDHGRNPMGKSCAYTILIQADRTKAQAFAANPQMKVLRFDRTVHAVRDDRTKTTGYVIFAPGNYPKPLESVSRPAFIGVTELAHAYELSVAISDPADRSPLKIKLTGADSVHVDPRYPLGNTIVVPKQ